MAVQRNGATSVVEKFDLLEKYARAKYALGQTQLGVDKLLGVVADLATEIDSRMKHPVHGIVPKDALKRLQNAEHIKPVLSDLRNLINTNTR